MVYYQISLYNASMLILFSYENKITGKKEPMQPVETFGGILADDMGLGKTLTVLSTIIRTASSAKEYAESDTGTAKSLKSEDQEVPQIHSRATLVVVPSPSMVPALT
jgi:SWI/SNF-related matrix-associated actin-dependent regulator of chromatin subfamily A3